jgi:hypothetical protein
LKREVNDLREKVIARDEQISNLYSKCEELVQVQVVEIPIYSGKAAKKGGGKKRNAVNRSKSQIRTNIF